MLIHYVKKAVLVSLTLRLLSPLVAMALPDSEISRGDYVSVVLAPKNELRLNVVGKAPEGEITVFSQKYPRSSTYWETAVSLSRPLVEAIYNQQKVKVGIDPKSTLLSVTPITKAKANHVKFSNILFNADYISLMIDKAGKTLFVVFEMTLAKNYKQNYVLGYNTFDNAEEANKFGNQLASVIGHYQQNNIPLSFRDSSTAILLGQPTIKKSAK